MRRSQSICRRIISSTAFGTATASAVGLETIGPSTKAVIEARFHAYAVEEQAYKSCIAMLKLAELYTDERLERACKLALQKNPTPSYSYLKNILAQGLDKGVAQSAKTRKAHAFLRGVAYYGGVSHEE